MSLNENAIKEITTLSAAANAANAMELSNNNIGNIPAIVIPNGYALQEIEYLQATPNEFRGLYETDNLLEFIDYVSIHSDSKESAVFINAEKMAAHARIDHGTPEQPLWGRHAAVLTLKQEDEYATLLYKNNQAYKQDEFVFFIEEYKDNIVFIDSDSVTIDFKDALKSLRSLKIDHINNKTQSVENFSVARSALESIEIKSANQALPAGFIFTCLPYENLTPVKFVAVLRAIASSNEVLLKYKLYQVNAIQKEITEEFKTLLSKELAGKINVHIGKFTNLIKGLG